jgi:sialate O-acetylesterase
MVLQRDTKVKIWGWASAGENVTVSFNDKNYQTTTDRNGKWLVTMNPMKAGGPYTMNITGSNHITLQNIVIGDVWVCSGQSNMELPMERVKEKYPDVVSNAANPFIRQFNIATNYVFTAPQQDLPSGNWQPANPQSVLKFSAVAYFFAKSLYEKYHVPIGLIKSAVGGSPAEAWISEDALKAFPNYVEAANRFKDSSYVDSLKKSDMAIVSNWNNKIKQEDQGLSGSKPWYDPIYQPEGWSTMQVPGYWDEHGLKGVNGVVWFRKEFDVPDDMVGKPAKLYLGRIVDADYAYVNGTLVGNVTYQYPPRRYEIPANLLKPGKNVIVVRVINSAGKGGFVLDKPYYLSVGGKTIDLKGEWQYKLGASVPPQPPTSTPPQYQPAGLYNAMIAPLLNYAIKGVIWYQGESNVTKASEYHALFTTLITNWRQKWNEGHFPFLFVQLANFLETSKEPGESQWAELREAQQKTLSLPNTGMAVIIDIGEWNDIHPLNKEDVGKRLALAAEKIAYGDNKVVYSGPKYQSMTVDGNKVILSFTHVGSGLMAKGGGNLKQFAIAGANKKFVWANAIIEGNTVIVWNDGVADPVAVRYAWADNPEGANLYNKEGLPASPFTTENQKE